MYHDPIFQPQLDLLQELESLVLVMQDLLPARPSNLIYLEKLKEISLKIKEVVPKRFISCAQYAVCFVDPVPSKSFLESRIKLIRFLLEQPIPPSAPSLHTLIEFYSLF